ncbi:MAG TPA: hypothetical protein VFG80_08080, partial [Myxococcota bacterium]|nr:hypothetical protein [Myxococcota bacterium]
MRRSLAFALALGTACATSTPVGVERMDAQDVHRELTESAISTGQPSAGTRELLTRLALREEFEKDPDAVLATLHAGLAPQGDLDCLFALAELSFVRAEQAGSREHADDLLARSFVVATGIGWKITRGERTDALCVVCSVSRKLPEPELT